MSKLKLRCPNSGCPNHKPPINTKFIKRGFFSSIDPQGRTKKYRRYQCPNPDCRKTFSNKGLSWQKDFKRPELLKEVFIRYTSGNSMRRISDELECNRETVARIVRLLGSKIKSYHYSLIEAGRLSTSFVGFDEMETYEHTKLKPLAIVLAVDVSNRKIIDARVCEIRAKGRTAPLSIAKYGIRQNLSPEVREEVASRMALCLQGPSSRITSDAKKAYLTLFRRFIPNATHHPIVSRAKFSVRDPANKEMGRFNNVCAVIRQYMSRMSRRSLVSTKNPDMLQAHLYLFIARYNAYSIVDILTETAFSEKQAG